MIIPIAKGGISLSVHQQILDKQNVANACNRVSLSLKKEGEMLIYAPTWKNLKTVFYLK